MKPEHHLWLLELAASFERSHRMGSAVDEPEGSRWISFSDTVAKEITDKLRLIAREAKLK